MTLLLTACFTALAFLISGIILLAYRHVSSPERQINRRVEEFASVYGQQDRSEPFCVMRVSADCRY